MYPQENRSHIAHHDQLSLVLSLLVSYDSSKASLDHVRNTPPEDLRAPLLELMVLQIQRHAQRHGYAVTKKRT